MLIEHSTTDKPACPAEQVVVRVGDQDPTTQGLDANTLCSVATINASSSMVIFDCQVSTCTP